MNWNYRVIEFTKSNGNKYRAIHEVFYTEYKTAKILTGYGEDPAVVIEDSNDPIEMFRILTMMSQALLRDILKAEVFEVVKKKEVK